MIMNNINNINKSIYLDPYKFRMTLTRASSLVAMPPALLIFNADWLINCVIEFGRLVLAIYVINKLFFKTVIYGLVDYQFINWLINKSAIKLSIN